MSAAASMSPRTLLWLHLLLAAGLAIHGHAVWADGRALGDTARLAAGSLAMLLALAPLSAGILLVAWPRATRRVNAVGALALLSAAAVLAWPALVAWVAPCVLLSALAGRCPEDAGVR